MLNFFDYVYYRICHLYYKTQESNPRIVGLIIIALMQSFNFISLFCIICILYQQKLNSTKAIILISGIIILILDGFRYNKLNYDVLKEKWKNENTSAQAIKGGIVLCYIILSTIICIGLAIYLGSQKW